jgi:hypothetical protein
MVEAVIQTGSLETRYRRTGQGAQLLMLACAEHVEWAGRMVPILAERFRVFLPEVPEWVPHPAGPREAPAGREWLRALIDGLGLDRPGVVAAPPLLGLLVDFVGTAADRLDRVVIIDDGSKPRLPLDHGLIRAFTEPRTARATRELLSYLNPAG